MGGNRKKTWASQLPAQACISARFRLLGTPLWLNPPAGRPRPLTVHDALLLTLSGLQGPLTRQHMAGLLWPDSAPGLARANLRQRIFRLNRDAAVPLLAGDPLLVLAPEAELDVQANDAQIELRLRADPLDLQGELLAGMDLAPFAELADSVQAWRQQWDDRRAAALHRLAEQAMAAGQTAAALRLAGRLVDDNPCSEAAHRRLIELHYLTGDRDSALAAYQRCRRALQQGMALAPSPQTEALLATVRAMALPPSLAQRPLATDARLPALTRPPRLLGREQVWAQTQAALDAGQPVLITGEAGIGKTRLLTDLATAGGGWPVVGARPGDAELPYALLSRLVDRLWRRFGPPAAEWAAAELARIRPLPFDGADSGVAPKAKLEPFTALRLLSALRQGLQDWAGPSGGQNEACAPIGGLVLDDLHFADQASLDLLLPLVGDARSGVHRWLLAARPGDLALAAPAWLARWQEQGGRVLRLLPLALDEVRALVTSLQLPELDRPGLAAKLAQATGGNPLFLLQTIAEMVGQGGVLAHRTSQALPAPGAAVSVVQRRIALLGSQERQLLRLAALVGVEFNAGLAAAVLRLPPLAIADAWQALQQAQLMRGDDCAHDLVREAALRDLPEALAQATHRSIAQALTELGASPARRARHWQAALCWPEAVQAWDAAAQAAAQREASAEEIAALGFALQCQSRALAPPAERSASLAAQAFDLTLRLAQALFRGGEPAAALQRLTALDDQSPTPLLWTRYLLLRAAVLAELGQCEPALAAAQQALALARGIGEHGLALQAAQRAAAALMGLGRADQALALMPADPPALAELSADDRLYWLCERGLLLDHANQREQSLWAHDQVIAEAQHQQRWLPAAVACCNKSVALLMLDRLRDSTECAERGIALSRRAGVDDAGLLVDEMNLAGNWRDLGWFSRYLARAERLPDELRAVGFSMWAANAEHDLAVAFVWLGRADLARRCLPALPPDTAGVMLAMRELTRVRLARDFDLPMLAPHPSAMLDQALAHLEAGGTRSGSVVQAIRLEQALLLPQREGVALAARIEQDALAQQHMLLTMAARRIQLLLLTAAGDRRAAAAVAEPMLARLQDSGAAIGVYLPALYLNLSQALADSAPERSAQVLGLAAQWIRRTAADHVPALYRDSFLHRNPVNRAVLNEVVRQGGVRTSAA